MLWSKPANAVDLRRPQPGNLPGDEYNEIDNSWLADSEQLMRFGAG